MANKDIHYTIRHSDTPDGDYEQDLTNMLPPVMYVNNDSEIVVENGVGIPWLNNGSWITYNNRASGVLVEVPDGKYINYLIVYTADVVAPIKMIVGDTVYDTELAASSADVSVFNYILERIRCKVAFKIVLHTDIAYVNNIGKVVVSKIENLADNTSLRNSMAPKNHSELGDSRFEDDQHEVDNIEGLRAAVDQVGQIKSARVIGNITGDGVLTDNTVIIDNRQTDTSLWGESDKSVVFQNLIGSVYSGRYKWVGAALAPNGKIYCAPHIAAQVLEIDPVTKTTALIGSVYSGAAKWAGATLAPNGKIYCAPAGAAQVLEIDPVTKTTTLIGSVYNGDAKWYGGALAPNGKIYCAPWGASQVLEIDPITKTTALIGSVYSGRYKWVGAALAPNGKIYCAPWGASQVLEIDPITKTTTMIGSVYSNSTGKWAGATLAPNGKIYCAPRNDTRILEIDPISKTTTLIGSVYSDSSENWEGAVLAPNGKIYCVPRDSTQVLEIDVFPKTTDYGSYLFSGQLKI